MSDIHYAVADPATAASMSGLEPLEAMREGSILRPPMGQRIPLDLVELVKGRILLSATADDSFLNPAGMVHGGLALTALDTAMGLATLSMLPAGKGYASIDTAVRFLRPLPGGRTYALSITGEVVSFGRTVVTLQGEMRTEQDKLVATGTSACAVFDLRKSVQ